MDALKYMPCAAVAFGASLSGAANASLLRNGSFEDGMATFFQSSADFDVNSNVAAPGWEYQITNGFLGIADDQPMFSDGAYFFYLLGVGEVYTAEADRASATAGTLYELSFQTRNDNSVNGMTASIEFFDAGGNLIGDGGSTSTVLVGEFGVRADVSTTGLAPTGTTSVGIRFDAGNLNDGGAQGGIFDDFVLTVVPTPGAATMAGIGLALACRRRRGR